jgi:hypothetical protein
MIKKLGKLTLATILAAVVLGEPIGAFAQPPTPAAPAPDAPATPAKKAKKPKGIPFTGKLLSVDQVNKTITLDQKTQRTFEITSDTKLTKDGKPATLEDAVVGEDIGGSYYTNNVDGKLIARSVRFGAKVKPAADATPKPADATPAK